MPQKCEEEQQILGEGFTEITAPPQGILPKRGETPPTKGAIINNNRTSSTLYQTALQLSRLVLLKLYDKTNFS